MSSEQLVQAVAVTAELCGRVFSPEAAKVFLDDLSGFDEGQVMAALRRCRMEVRGVLTISDVITRLDDGRPGADEAFAMLPRSESESVVWTDEMAQAFGSCTAMLDAGETNAARLAFREAYTKLVNKARDERKRVNWTPSLGHSLTERLPVLEKARQLGRLSAEQYLSLTGYETADKAVLEYVGPALKIT